MATTGERLMAQGPPETVVVCSQVRVHGAPGCTHNATYETAVSSLRYT
jgi:hypothetical protein